MRDILSSVFAYGAFALGVVLASAWGCWIWGFDWGHGRAFGLWGMTFGIGGIIVFLIGFGGGMVLHSWLFPGRKA